METHFYRVAMAGVKMCIYSFAARDILCPSLEDGAALTGAHVSLANVSLWAIVVCTLGG